MKMQVLLCARVILLLFYLLGITHSIITFEASTLYVEMHRERTCPSYWMYFDDILDRCALCSFQVKNGRSRDYRRNCNDPRLGEANYKESWYPEKDYQYIPRCNESSLLPVGVNALCEDWSTKSTHGNGSTISLGEKCRVSCADGYISNLDQPEVTIHCHKCTVAESLCEWDTKLPDVVCAPPPPPKPMSTPGLEPSSAGIGVSSTEEGGSDTGTKPPVVWIIVSVLLVLLTIIIAVLCLRRRYRLSNTGGGNNNNSRRRKPELCEVSVTEDAPNAGEEQGQMYSLLLSGTANDVIGADTAPPESVPDGHTCAAAHLLSPASTSTAPSNDKMMTESSDRQRSVDSEDSGYITPGLPQGRPTVVLAVPPTTTALAIPPTTPLAASPTATPIVNITNKYFTQITQVRNINTYADNIDTVAISQADTNTESSVELDGVQGVTATEGSVELDGVQRAGAVGAIETEDTESIKTLTKEIESAVKLLVAADKGQPVSSAEDSANHITDHSSCSPLVAEVMKKEKSTVDCVETALTGHRADRRSADMSKPYCEHLLDGNMEGEHQQHDLMTSDGQYAGYAAGKKFSDREFTESMTGKEDVRLGFTQTTPPVPTIRSPRATGCDNPASHCSVQDSAVSDYLSKSGKHASTASGAVAVSSRFRDSGISTANSEIFRGINLPSQLDTIPRTQPRENLEDLDFRGIALDPPLPSPDKPDSIDNVGTRESADSQDNVVNSSQNGSHIRTSTGDSHLTVSGVTAGSSMLPNTSKPSSILPNDVPCYVEDVLPAESEEKVDNVVSGGATGGLSQHVGGTSHSTSHIMGPESIEQQRNLGVAFAVQPSSSNYHPVVEDVFLSEQLPLPEESDELLPSSVGQLEEMNSPRTLAAGAIGSRYRPVGTSNHLASIDPQSLRVNLPSSEPTNGANKSFPVQLDDQSCTSQYPCSDLKQFHTLEIPLNKENLPAPYQTRAGFGLYDSLELNSDLKETPDVPGTAHRMDTVNTLPDYSRQLPDPTIYQNGGQLLGPEERDVARQELNRGTVPGVAENKLTMDPLGAQYGVPRYAPPFSGYQYHRSYSQPAYPCRPEPPPYSYVPGMPGATYEYMMSIDPATMRGYHPGNSGYYAQPLHRNHSLPAQYLHQHPPQAAPSSGVNINADTVGNVRQRKEIKVRGDITHIPDLTYYAKTVPDATFNINARTVGECSNDTLSTVISRR